MDFLDNIILGFQVALTWQALAYCLMGVTIGTFIGVLPGLGALAAVSLLLPVTFYLDPLSALILLAGVFYGAEYGGSTSAILLNLPGNTSSVVVCLDGHPLAKQGRAGVALFITAIASFVGGSIGIVLLMAFAPLLVQVSQSFGSPEYFALMLFGLIASASVGQGGIAKSIAMVILGVALGTIGVDINSGIPRFTFGAFELYEGINIVALAMGLYGVSEIISSVANKQRYSTRQRISIRSMFPSWAELRSVFGAFGRGSAIGSLMGILPGTGATIASYLSYAVEKGVAKDKSRFGRGALEGIAGPESSNNAAAQTNFIPTLAMGIPGSASMAIILGALMIHGITPGPSFIGGNPDLFWGLVASFWIGNVMLLVLNIPLINLWVSLLNVPYRFLFPVIIGLICAGAYAVSTNAFNVFMVLVFGVLGVVLRRLRFDPAPLLIGFVLGPMIEENFRRTLRLSRGDFSAFWSSPISAIVLALCVGLIAWGIYASFRRKGGAAQEAEAA